MANFFLRKLSEKKSDGPQLISYVWEMLTVISEEEEEDWFI
jgi:hypothetical protein